VRQRASALCKQDLWGRGLEVSAGLNDDATLLKKVEAHDLMSQRDIQPSSSKLNSDHPSCPKIPSRPTH